MDKINYIGTDDTPSIILDAEKGFFEISGRSMPEDVASFYKPILEWLDNYSENPKVLTIFNFKLTYFNTASSKLILDILVKLEDLHSAEHSVLAKWHYPSIDEDMKDAGEEYAEMVDVPFEQIEYIK